jgi:uroporphyrinogen-III synthase
MRLLITRPEPAASNSAAALRAMGHQVICAPVLGVQSQNWQSPTMMPHATLFTSANAVRLGGAGLHVYHHLPALAVGEATAAALRQAGFTDIHLGGGDLRACVSLAQAMGFTSLLHLAGANRTSATLPDTMRIMVRIVYRAKLIAQLPQRLADTLRRGEVDVALLYSVRSAQQFATLFDLAGLDRRLLKLVALSPAVLSAAGTGWHDSVAAAAPRDAAVFAAIQRMCNEG